MMSKVVPAFMEWAWKTFDVLVRLNAEAAENNPGSNAVLKRAGFVFEGRRPNAAVSKTGELVHLNMYGALRPE